MSGWLHGQDGLISSEYSQFSQSFSYGLAMVLPCTFYFDWLCVYERSFVSKTIQSSILELNFIQNWKVKESQEHQRRGGWKRQKSRPRKQGYKVRGRVLRCLLQVQHLVYSTFVKHSKNSLYISRKLFKYPGMGGK